MNAVSRGFRTLVAVGVLAWVVMAAAAVAVVLLLAMAARAAARRHSL